MTILVCSTTRLYWDLMFAVIQLSGIRYTRLGPVIQIRISNAPYFGAVKSMKKKLIGRIAVQWLIVAYLCLIVEKTIFTGVIEVFRASQGEESMGIGFFLINVFILPFVQVSIWQLGGNLAMFTMIGFALTSYMLCLKGMWKIVPVLLGSFALVFSLMYDLTMNPKLGVGFLFHFGCRVTVITLVTLLGLNANRIFDKLTGRAGNES